MGSRTWVIVLAVGCSTAFLSGQTREITKEATVADAARVKPLAPTGLSVNPREGGAAALSWKPVPLEKIVGYRVYRKVGDSVFQALDTVKAPSFVDRNVPSGKVEYAVTSMDHFDNESRLSKPVVKPDADAKPPKGDASAAKKP